MRVESELELDMYRHRQTRHDDVFCFLSAELDFRTRIPVFLLLYVVLFGFGMVWFGFLEWNGVRFEI
jgi:hypothetical protein